MLGKDDGGVAGGSQSEFRCGGINKGSDYPDSCTGVNSNVMHPQQQQQQRDVSHAASNEEADALQPNDNGSSLAAVEEPQQQQQEQVQMPKPLVTAANHEHRPHQQQVIANVQQQQQELPQVAAVAHQRSRSSRNATPDSLTNSKHNGKRDMQLQQQGVHQHSLQCQQQQQQGLEQHVLHNQQQQQQQGLLQHILPAQQQQGMHQGKGASDPDPHWVKTHPAELWRLGLLMAVTMTLHNLPEGFAVAFSAYTDIGPIMALAIALHNIPEGLMIAAPIYAATNSRWQALGLATASGLSEPVGAAAALMAAKPFVTSLQQLDYLLAATGGVMLAVCVVELWPEGRKCGRDMQMVLGILLGTAVMAWTLYVGV